MLFFQPTRGSPTPDKPRRRVPGGGLAWLPLSSSKKRRVPSSLRKKHYLCTRICACGEIGRRARLRIWWPRPCRFESYQAHRCSFTKKATTYTASPPGKPCKLLPLFVQLPWKAAVRRYFNAYSTLTYKKTESVHPRRRGQNRNTQNVHIPRNTRFITRWPPECTPRCSARRRPIHTGRRADRSPP